MSLGDDKAEEQWIAGAQFGRPPEHCCGSVVVRLASSTGGAKNSFDAPSRVVAWNYDPDLRKGSPEPNRYDGRSQGDSSIDAGYYLDMDGCSWSTRTCYEPSRDSLWSTRLAPHPPELVSRDLRRGRLDEDPTGPALDILG